MTDPIDISPPVDDRIAVWPGDVAFARRVTRTCESGDSYGLSDFTSTVHVGAHTDAPNHYVAGGDAIDARPLRLYYGPCQVVEVSLERDRRIAVADVDLDAIGAERVLFKTSSFPDPTSWNEDFNALSVELVDALATRGVRLIGIDTPSVDLFADAELEAHHAIARHDMAILEGVVLAHVAPGRYTLIALPLRLVGADASPVRAALVPEPS